MSRRRDRSLVVAAQGGDRRAREEVARTCLPLVYNVVGRALGTEAGTEDVVQETMLRVMRGLPGLRQPENLRSWTLAIAVRQISEHQARTEPSLAKIEDQPLPSDFENLTILRLQLSGQRRQVAQAARWLDADHRTVLALWWQEMSGHLDRADLAGSLGTTLPYAAVRVQRMRGQLDRARAVVAALEARPGCGDLTQLTGDWDGEPSPLWRKRFDRHVRDCPTCSSTGTDTVPVEKLLAGLGLVTVPIALTGKVLADVAGAAPANPATPARGVRRLRHSVQANPLVSAAAVTLVVMGTVGAIGGVALTSRGTPAVAPQVPVVALSTPTTPAATPSPVVTTRSVTPNATPRKTTPKATPTARKTTPRAVVTTTKAAPACDDGSTASTWADWAMPNPVGSGLPNPAHYRASGGVVTDKVTCLEWQQEAAPDAYSWKAAQKYCTTLKLDGGGWHLPTRVELTSIVDTTRDNPAINPDAFPGTTPRFFWTSTPWAVTKAPARSWIINFYEGVASNNAEQSAEFNVRCVRSDAGTGGPDYEVTSSTVTDPGTGLVWQRRRSPELTPAQARTYCGKLGSGWRLPSIQELATTVDETQVSPAVNRTAFPDTAPDARYWSATPVSPKPESRWALNYADGFITYRDQTTGYVRCVK